MTDTAPRLDIEIWVRNGVTSYTLVYVDAKGHEHRPATRPTEFECRQFARQHGWEVGELRAEGEFR